MTKKIYTIPIVTKQINLVPIITRYKMDINQNHVDKT